MSIHVALLVCQELQDLHLEDQMLRKELENFGWDVGVYAWDDDQIFEKPIDGAVIRSTWDYHQRVDAFNDTLERLEKRGATLVNSASLVRWNSDKIYLQSLREKGLDVVPSEFFCWESPQQVDVLFQKIQTEQLVLKPRVSASSHSTYKIAKSEWCGRDSSTELFRQTVHQDLLSRHVIAQPFVESIESEGERSLVFFDHKFSHGVIKTPCPGEFRVQEEFGGEVQRRPFNEDVVNFCLEVLHNIPERAYYARVDVVTYHKRISLMEVELIEPFLFLEYEPQSVKAFAQVLQQKLLSKE